MSLSKQSGFVHYKQKGKSERLEAWERFYTVAGFGDVGNVEGIENGFQKLRTMSRGSQ